MKPELKCLSNPSPPSTPSRLLDAARLIRDHLGAKAIPVAHLSEKLSGERPLSLADLDAIAAAIPAQWPHLRELWVSALLGWECVCLSRLEGGPVDSVPPQGRASFLSRKAA